MICAFDKLFVLFITFVLLSSYVSAKCEKVQIPFCEGIGYNMTIMPNHLGDETQAEAKSNSALFNSLVGTKCSSDLTLFLCTMYAPVCTETRLPPCRSLCENSRKGCEGIMNMFGYTWPDRFQCNKFPVAGMCVARNTRNSNEAASKKKKGIKQNEVVIDD